MRTGAASISRAAQRHAIVDFCLYGQRKTPGNGPRLDSRRALAKAREKAGHARTAFLEGRDPIAERAATPRAEAAPVTFGAFADDLLDDIQQGFRNEKHRKQWRSTLKTHAAALLETAVAAVDTGAVVEVLKPIWLTKPETASRVRGRIERVLDAAKARGLRTSENPARWRGISIYFCLDAPRHRRSIMQHWGSPMRVSLCVISVRALRLPRARSNSRYLPRPGLERPWEWFGQKWIWNRRCGPSRQNG